MSSTLGHVNGTSAPERTDPWPLKIEPEFDPVALARAEAIRTEANAKADALRVEAAGKAKAAELVGVEEAEKVRLQNERAAMKLEVDRAVQAERIAKLNASAADAEAAAERSRRAVADEAEAAAAQDQEERRSETTWKWAARGIYAVGLIIALPLQLMAFYSKDKPFMIAAPLLLEGFALVLAFAAAWAVTHRRDVMPYRIAIMVAAATAAGINLWHGIDDDRIGVGAGVVGTLASLGGPLVLMAYEHGITQKRDGIPSWRERRDEEKRVGAERAEAERKASEKSDADQARADEKKAAEHAARAEQERKDKDRQTAHPAVWKIADAMRSARGLEAVSDQIWAEAWYRETGSKVVGIWPELEAQSRTAAARMKAASEGVLEGSSPQVESQMNTPAKRDPNAPDGRRSNGGLPPLRTPGDTAPYSPLACIAASESKRKSNAENREGETA